ncbi:MAG: CRISPR-associated RAMP protein Csx7 [candidate division KSB1 bacterium]|nr:CRISPR-associated RAMP protein Csx7 [candidate division KSB1 bacterium]
MAMWDTFSNQLLIRGELVATTALRIGSGVEALDPAGADLPVIRDSLGRPFIPGSSLRGVLRSHVERIVRSLEPSPGQGQGACDPVTENAWCIRGEHMEEFRKQEQSKGPGGLAELVWKRSCRVCRVFGSPWLASRVRITDLYPVEGNPWHIQVRDGVAIDRDKETVRNKYDFEVVTAGARFQLEIVADNLDEVERGLLWLVVRELRDGRLRVGGFRGRGLGSVRVEKLKLQFVSAEDRDKWLAYLVKGEMQDLQPDVADEWLNALIHEMTGGRECTAVS